MIFDHNKIFGVHHIKISLIFQLKSQLVTTGDTTGPHWRHSWSPLARAPAGTSEDQLCRQWKPVGAPVRTSWGPVLSPVVSPVSTSQRQLSPVEIFYSSNSHQVKCPEDRIVSEVTKCDNRHHRYHLGSSERGSWLRIGTAVNFMIFGFWGGPARAIPEQILVG